MASYFTCQVEVSADDILDELSDEQIRQLYIERFGGGAAPGILREIERCLYAGRINDALAIIVAEQISAGNFTAGKLSEYRRLHGVK